MKSSTLIVGSIILSAAFIVGAFLVEGEPRSDLRAAPVTVSADGTQVITVRAQGGYTPRTIVAQANASTTLRVETKGTFDCSAALVIPDLSVQEFLPPTGVREFSVPPQAPGSVIDGTCSMGMYGFRISFQ